MMRALVNMADRRHGSHLRQDIAGLEDIYHTLGASRMAFILAAFFCYSYLFMFNPGAVTNEWSGAVPVVYVFLAFCLMLLTAPHRGQRDTSCTITARLEREIRLWYLGEILTQQVDDSLPKVLESGRFSRTAAGRSP